MGPEFHRVFMYTPDLSVSNQKESPQQESAIMSDSTDTSQVKLLITTDAFCIVQRATAQSKTGIFRDFGVAEAPPGFQAGWSVRLFFFFSFSVHFARSCGVAV
jgi:hypothetical protein